MKTNALFSLCIGIILCQAFFLTSCSESNGGNDDIIWDFAPINFIIAVQYYDYFNRKSNERVW